jgi:hypothetical protein
VIIKPTSTVGISHTSPLVLDSLVDTEQAILARTFQQVWIRPSEGRRINGKTFQITLRDGRQYVVDNDTNHVTVNHSGAAGPVQPGVAAGAYATIDAVLSELVAALNIAIPSGAPWTGTFVGDLVRITAGAGTWNVTMGDADTENLWVILGFNVTQDLTPAAFQEAVTEVYKHNSCALELGGIVLKVRPTKRRPS